jgi:hypothetical protein
MMGIFEDPRNYTIRDLVYWMGFFTGAIGGYGLLFHVVEVPYPIIGYIGLLVCGLALGFLCETIYKNARNGPRDGEGPNPPPPM